MTDLYPLDYFSLIYFITLWVAYAWITDHSRFNKYALNRLVSQHRTSWFFESCNRENRVMDSNILMGQMNGAIFFASSTLIAIGGTITLFGQQELLLSLSNKYNFFNQPSNLLIEAKILALLLVFSYGFFKFGWAYRLYSYCSIVLGNIPAMNTDLNAKQAHTLARNAANINIQAGKHFARGQRAIFYSLAILAWFIGNEAFIMISTILTLSMLRRQFYSKTVYILRKYSQPDDTTD